MTGTDRTTFIQVCIGFRVIFLGPPACQWEDSRFENQTGHHVEFRPAVQKRMNLEFLIEYEVSSYLHHQTHKRRAPVYTPSAVPTAANAAGVSSATIDVMTVISRCFMPAPLDARKSEKTARTSHRELNGVVHNFFADP